MWGLGTYSKTACLISFTPTPNFHSTHNSILIQRKQGKRNNKMWFTKKAWILLWPLLVQKTTFIHSAQLVTFLTILSMANIRMKANGTDFWENPMHHTHPSGSLQQSPTLQCLVYILFSIFSLLKKLWGLTALHQLLNLTRLYLRYTENIFILATCTVLSAVAGFFLLKYF